MRTFLFLLFTFSYIHSRSQGFGDYRSLNSGDWNGFSTWEQFDGTKWQPTAVSPSNSNTVVEIRNSHTVTITSPVTIDEFYVDEGGTLVVNSTLTVVDGIGTDLTLGGTISGTGSTIINGVMNWIGKGSIASPFLLSSEAVLNITSNNIEKAWRSTMTNAGTINWGAGDMYFYAVLTNIGTINYTGVGTVYCSAGTINNIGIFNTLDGGFVNNGAPNSFVNSGILSKTAGSGTMTIRIPFSNNGIMNVISGVLALGSGNDCVNTGPINIAVGATFANNSNLSLNTGTIFSGSGTFQMAGTESFNVPLNMPATMLLNLTAGPTAGTGLVTVNGVMNWSGNGSIASPFTLTSGAVLNITTTNVEKAWRSTMTNAGTINWGAGDMYFFATLTNTGTINYTSGGTIYCSAATINNSGTFNASDGGIFSNGGTNSFINSGTLSKIAGNGTTSINIPTTNTGVIKGNGTINFGTTFTNNGKIAPGLSPGLLTIASSSPIFTANSSLIIELQSDSGAGKGYDQLRVGNVALAGNLTLTDLGVPGAVRDTIISSSGLITGTFSSITQTGGYSVIYNSNSVVVIRAQGPLPVVLMLFSADFKETTVDLSWQTATEYNSDNFIIERSEDGILFTQIGSVKATGNGSNKVDYTFGDEKPLPAVSYYRLKMTDKDGKYEYSKTVKVDRFQIIANPTIFPNPVINSFTVRGLDVGRLKIIQLLDANGHLIYRAKTTDKQLTIQFSKEPQGMYLLQIIQDGKVTSHKIIKR